MKVVTVGIAVIVAMGLSSSGLANESSQSAKALAAQKSAQFKVADNAGTTPAADSKEAIAAQKKNAQNNAQSSGQSQNPHQQSASNGSNPDDSEND